MYSIIAYAITATAITTNMVVMINYSLLLHCRQPLDYLWLPHFAVDDCDLFRAAVGHTLTDSIPLLSNSIELQDFLIGP